MRTTETAGLPRPSLAHIDARARQARQPGGLDLIHVHYPADVQALMLEIARQERLLEQVTADRDRALAQLHGIRDTLSVIAGTLTRPRHTLAVAK